jgi:hypothetical protein
VAAAAGEEAAVWGERLVLCDVYQIPEPASGRRCGGEWMEVQ